MKNNENKWDKLLQIKTTGRDDIASDQYRFPYEPTPYSVLERLADSGLIGAEDTVLDYGCGKGRVGLFISYRTKAKTVGIEYDERIYKIAEENRKTAVSGAKGDFIMTRAEEYKVPSEINRVYFFNPFSIEILSSVVGRIIGSYYEAPREIFLFFYYPSDEYVSYLMTVDELMFYDEIDCSDLFDGENMRERILVFRLNHVPITVQTR